MKRSKLVILIPSLMVIGCSHKPFETAGLKSAQSSYLSMKKDEMVVNEAPMELLKAAKIYEMSKNAKTEESAEHLAYMLQKQVEVAKNKAKTKSLKQKIIELKQKKAEALLQEKENQILLMKKEAQRAKEEAEKSKQKLLEMKELNAKQTNRGLVLTLGDVLFETGKSNLLPGSMRAIDKLAEFLEDNPERMVLIEGHTDNVGSATFNLDLSLRRSLSVEEALISKGISKDRLIVKGYGEVYPVASNSDLGGRQRNRRVEIVILEEGIDPASMMRDSQDN